MAAGAESSGVIGRQGQRVRPQLGVHQSPHPAFVGHSSLTAAARSARLTPAPLNVAPVQTPGTSSRWLAIVPVLVVAKVRLLAHDGGENAAVGEDHDGQRDEVDGEQEAEREAGDGRGVRAESDALLVLGLAGSRPRVPHEGLGSEIADHS